MDNNINQLIIENEKLKQQIKDNEQATLEKMNNLDNNIKLINNERELLNNTLLDKNKQIIDLQKNLDVTTTQIQEHIINKQLLDKKQ